MYATCASMMALAAMASLAAGETIRFDNRVGAAPSGWTVAMTHEGGAPEWKIVRDETAPSPPNALGQLSSDSTSSRFPLMIFNEFVAVNGSIAVKFRTVSGKEDQAAGLVWRYLDPDNYYVARANALENNVVAYKVEHGKRTAIAPRGSPANTYGVKHAVPSDRWNSLSVDFSGGVFTVSFNGERLFEVEDGAFTAPGKVGLWTKADSVTYFDDFSAEKR